MRGLLIFQVDLSADFPLLIKKGMTKMFNESNFNNAPPPQQQNQQPPQQPPQQQYYQPPYPPQQPYAHFTPKRFIQRPKFTRLDFFSYPILFVLFYSFLHGLFNSSGAETTFSFWGIFGIATADIVSKTKRFPAKAIFPGAICLLSSLHFILYTDSSYIQAGVILLLMLFSGIYCICLTGTNVHSFSSIYVLLDILRCELFLPIKNIFIPGASLHQSRKFQRANAKAPVPKKNKRIVLPIILGILTGLIILSIVLPLLLSSDLVFEKLLGNASEVIKTVSKAVREYLKDIIFIQPLLLFAALIFTPFVFSVIFGFGSGVTLTENRDTSTKYRKLQKLPVAYIAAALGVVSVIYIVYIITQSTYLFSAFSGHLPFGLTISVTEYARQGFFEMLKIAFANLALIFLSVGLGKRANGKISSIIKGFGIFLSIFNILICAISLSKILLYINTYGLTEKRFFVLVGDIVLIVSFIAILLRFFIEKMPYMRIILFALSVSITVVALLGVNSTIARHNANLIIANKNTEIHADELFEESGWAAIPQLERVVSSKCEKAGEAALALDNIYRNDGPDKSEGFSFELSRAKKWALSKSKSSDGLSFNFDVEDFLVGSTAKLQIISKDNVLIEKSFVFEKGKNELALAKNEFPELFDAAPVKVKLSVTFPSKNKYSEPKTETVCLEPDDSFDCYFGRTYSYELYESFNDNGEIYGCFN